MINFSRAPHTDSPTGGWIDKTLPLALRPYARLMRLDRPIGTWLLLLPCWWSVLLAKPTLDQGLFILYFAMGALIMRGAGCVVNDLWDKDIDRKVERTRSRPLASGQLKPRQAFLFLALLLSLGFLILIQFNPYTILLGAASLPLIIIYPLMKRITSWPQLVLGVAFNWGALMGWAAVRGRLEPAAFLLYAGGIFWTLAYDTIYAHQDKKDDRKIGVKSLALLFGARSRFWVSLFFTAAICLFTLSGIEAHVGKGFYLIMIAVADHAWLQVKSWNIDDPANCLRQFKSNRDLGLLMLLACFVGLF